MVIYVIFIPKCMGFASQKLWVMGYEGVWIMFQFPAYQLGRTKILWVMEEYELSELCIIRESAVAPGTTAAASQPLLHVLHWDGFFLVLINIVVWAPLTFV